MSIKATRLANEIAKQLAKYAHGVGEEVGELAEKLAKEGAQLLKETSPKRLVKGGTYAKGWKAEKVKGVWVVHNAKSYRLTHLLEKGHALADGGRTREFVHIKPVEDKLINEFTKGVEGAIKR